MKVLTSLFLWTIGFAYFGALCIAGIILTYLVPQRKLDPWIKKRLRFLFKLLWTKVEVEGAKKIQSDQTYLFMSNHVSLFDIPLLGGYIPTFVRGVEATRQFKWPLYGWAVRRLGNIPIDRKNIHASIRSMRKTENFLREGVSIAIMPEGHRTLTGEMRPFKKLPFYLAKQAGTDIVPIGLSGLFHMKPKTSWLLRPSHIKIKFGKIITAKEVEKLSVVELRDLTYHRIHSLIEYA